MALTVLVSQDQQLITQVTEIAAELAIELVVVGEAAPVRALSPRLVLCGGDLAPDAVAELRMIQPGVRQVAFGAVGSGGRSVILLPQQRSRLVRTLEQVRERGPGQIVGVCGVRGGLGVSVFAAALAAAISKHEPVVLAQADVGGVGLECLLSIENQPGPRWAEVLEVGPGRGVMSQLPRWGKVSVLSAGGGMEAFGSEVLTQVRQRLDELASSVKWIVLDIPRDLGMAERARVAGWCGSVVLLVGRDLRSVRSAKAELEMYAESLPVWILACDPAPGGLLVSQLAANLGVERVMRLRRERGLPAAIEHGVRPGERRMGSLARTAKRVAAQVMA